MLIHGPGVPCGERHLAQVYLRDVFPTVCEAGVAALETFEGRSFRPVLRDAQAPARKSVAGYFRDKQRMIRTDRHKIIWYPHPDR
jgi:arylsulfatase A-like enzyme